MVERQKSRYGWEFLFLGANIDAVDVASRCGIGAQYAANYHCDEEGTARNFDALSDAVMHVRCCEPIAADWKDSIDEDFANRRSKR